MRVRVLLPGVLLAGSLLAPSESVLAQTRLNDPNAIGWLTNTTTLNFNRRWGAHLEYQFRRDELLRSWQQSLLRTGVNYRVNEQLSLRLGYAWIETFPYGDYPIQAAGRPFPEHRLFQMATLRNPVGRVDVSHRFLLEQRWVGRFNRAESPRPDDWVYSNRVRYMLRAQLPLGKPKREARTFYVAAYDEVFIGFGRNVGENVFDQNRLGLLLGYRFSPTFRLEGGFLQQILQLGREIGGRNVFQYNNGLIVNTVIDLNLSKN